MSQRWQKLESLFVAALDLPPDQRDAFVARETAGDGALATELSGMLASEGAAASRLSAIIESAAQQLPAPGDWAGRRFGPYRIVREIGRGGMGLVFEAARDDDAYQKRVALKVAPWWHGTAASHDRFRSERQLLAQLEHPHIARLLDGGTEHGTPYFVMEYVDGQPLTAYAEQHHLSLRARLALFRAVCEAVRFAHERLIVHRDLKPANIMVGADRTPKLLDFGIAKLLDPVADPAATLGEPIWTPDYASPEQVRGRPVTTRTDVYSLGLVLYELLAGVRAQKADSTSPLALDTSVCETMPPAPSAAASGRGELAMGHRLRGDLDTIILTAIAKEPERRYESVAALSDDLGRFLEGRPIRARASTWTYRAGRFLGRNKTATAAALILLVSVAAGTVSTAYQARRAERRFQQVRALANTFVFDIHDRIQSLPGATEARKAIVQTALTYLENLQEDAGGDPALARELAAAYARIGDVQGHPLSANLGDSAGALASYARAHDLLTPLAARADRDAIRQLATVTRHRASVYQAAGNLEATLEGLKEALGDAEQLVASQPGDLGGWSLVSEASSDLARLAFQTRNFELAEQAGGRAMEAARELVTRDPGNPDHRAGLASAHNARGMSRHLTGRLEDATADFRESTTVRERLVADDPMNASRRRGLMISYGNLGDVLGFHPDNLGEWAGAIEALDKAVAMAVWAMERDPADRRAQFDVASARLRLGGVLTEDGTSFDRAVDELQEARRLTASLLALEPASERYAYLQLVIDARLGEAMARDGRRDEAIRVLNRVRTAAPGFLTGINASSARSVLLGTSVALGQLRADTGHLEAITLADWAYGELAKAPLGNVVRDARLQGRLGRVYLTAGLNMPAKSADLAAKAEDCLEKSAALWRGLKTSGRREESRLAQLGADERDLLAAGRLARAR